MDMSVGFVCSFSESDSSISLSPLVTPTSLIDIIHLFFLSFEYIESRLKKGSRVYGTSVIIIISLIKFCLVSFGIFFLCVLNTFIFKICLNIKEYISFFFNSFLNSCFLFLALTTTTFFLF